MTGTGVKRPRRAAVVSAAVAAAVAAPVAAKGAARGPDDHLLLAVTAGRAGAQGFATTLTVQVTDAGTGPRTSLFGLGTTRGGAIVADEGGGGPLRLSTTSGAGGVSAQLAGPVQTLGPQPVTMSIKAGRLAPGETVVVLEAFGNFHLSGARLPRYTLSAGSVRLRLVHGPGTVAVRVGDPSDGMVAADAGPVGAGAQQRKFAAPSDIGGAFVYTPMGVTTSSWLAPDGNNGRWAAAGSVAAGWPSFAGPRGRWELDWVGADVSPAGNPVVGAYTPLAGYWKFFRCRTDCMFPANLPPATSAQSSTVPPVRQ